MMIHEYQAKALMRDAGIRVPDGVPILLMNNFDKEVAVLEGKLTDRKVVIKAQIHAGGRGKAGGVKVLKSLTEARDMGNKMMGAILVTPQTGENGQMINRLYVEVGENIVKEYYISLILDRSTSQLVFIASAEGGMDIEEVAEHSPEKITKVFIDITIGVTDNDIQTIGKTFDLSSDIIKNELDPFLKKIYQLFIEKDATQIEINPLVLNNQNQLVALDGKMSFDENALFRHKEDIMPLHDATEDDPMELEAMKFNLNYIKMDGEIGCMVNGAGLAMATMDIIAKHGGSAANFLDVGGGATVETVKEAFRIILSDKKVKGIFVNIFGGIMRCDIIAQGIIEAVKQCGLDIPVVARLVGTNFELGCKMLEESGLRLLGISDFDEATRKIVEEVKK